MMTVKVGILIVVSFGFSLSVPLAHVPAVPGSKDGGTSIHGHQSRITSSREKNPSSTACIPSPIPLCGSLFWC